MKKKYCPKTKLELRKLILNEEVELGEINTSKITDMSHLFEPTLRGGEQARFFFNGIETWDVSNVVDMSYMFCYARNFNEDITKWNVQNVRTMRGMFQFASSFNQDIGNWNVSSVTNMASMFYDASAFNQNLDKWDVSSVKTMRFMFMYARYFEKKPIWDLSNVEDVAGMFYGSPIVYVDPNLACAIDPSLEDEESKKRIEEHLQDTLESDGIAKFAKNLVQKSTTIADRLEARFDSNQKTIAPDTKDTNENTENVSKEPVYLENDPQTKVVTEKKTSQKETVASKNSFIDDLERLQKLKETGLISDDELLILKEKILKNL